MAQHKKNIDKFHSKRVYVGLTQDHPRYAPKLLEQSPNIQLYHASKYLDLNLSRNSQF